MQRAASFLADLMVVIMLVGFKMMACISTTVSSKVRDTKDVGWVGTDPETVALLLDAGGDNQAASSGDKRPGSRIASDLSQQPEHAKSRSKTSRERFQEECESRCHARVGTKALFGQACSGLWTSGVSWR